MFCLSSVLVPSYKQDASTPASSTLLVVSLPDPELQSVSDADSIPRKIETASVPCPAVTLVKAAKMRSKHEGRTKKSRGKPATVNKREQQTRQNNRQIHECVSTHFDVQQCIATWHNLVASFFFQLKRCQPKQLTALTCIDKETMQHGTRCKARDVITITDNGVQVENSCKH
jgi:hypothetical protein